MHLGLKNIIIFLSSQLIAHQKEEYESRTTPNSAQGISNLREGECFRRNMRPQTRYQT